MHSLNMLGSLIIVMNVFLMSLHQKCGHSLPDCFQRPLAIMRKLAGYKTYVHAYGMVWFASVVYQCEFY